MATKQTTILIVDDESSIRRFIAKHLTKFDFQVQTAENGRQAMALIESALPDLVITDLFMPEADGFTLLAFIREHAPDLPVMVMSGQGELGDAIQALRLGAWDYLYKPLESTFFLQLSIERVLEKARLVAENKAYRERLEEQVMQKSAELLKNNLHLEKTNQTLKDLLEQREIEKKAVEASMVANLKRFVFPHLDDLEQEGIGKNARVHLNAIRSNIEQLISPVSKTLSGAYRDLSPAEIRVADLIRQGEPTKSISDIMHISPSTVEKHRNKIRKKLKILNKKINLYSHLNSLD